MAPRTFVGLHPGHLSEREDVVTVAAHEVGSGVDSEVGSGVGSGVGDPQ